jgi:hypothetical protein
MILLAHVPTDLGDGTPIHVPGSFRSVVSLIKISSQAGEGKMRVEVSDVFF